MTETQWDYLKQVLVFTLWPDFQNEDIMNWDLRGYPPDSVPCIAYLIKVKFAFIENNSHLNG